MKERVRMKIEDIQSNLDSMKTLKFTQNKEFNNIEEVIRFACQNSYTIDNSTTPSNSKKIQCVTGTSRGIADLYRICKYYFPNTNLQEVVNTVKKIPMNYGYCYTTNQDVYKVNTIDWLWVINQNNKADKNDPSIRLKNRKRVFIEK